MIKNRNFSAFKVFLAFIFLFSVVLNPAHFFANTTDRRVNSLLEQLYKEKLLETSRRKENASVVYSRLKLAREHNYSSKPKSAGFAYKDSETLENTFEQIFEEDYWNRKSLDSSESRSGRGSKLSSTQAIRGILPIIWEKYGVKSVLDVPCGDFNWMKDVDKMGIEYTGGDIVEEIISRNNSKYVDKNVSFQALDITKDRIPKVDMIFCRDCLQHLSYENVKKTLINFKNSGSTYLMVTSYPLTLENWDIVNGDYRPLNLLKKPLNLEKNYLEAIAENHGNGNEFDKTLYLFKLSDINLDNFDDNQSANTVNNIPIAMALDDNYLYPTIVVMTSIMENSNSKINHEFYIMHPSEFKSENKTKLLSLEKKYKNCKINLVNMKNKFKNVRTGHVTTPAYYRLALTEVAPKCDKIIWLDGDTLVYHDLTEMMNIDMDGYYYKGFLDYPRLVETKKFGVRNDHYICSGVMLINLKELRDDNIIQKFNEFIEKNGKSLPMHDQTVINVVCYEKNGLLPAKFGIWHRYLNRYSAKDWSKKIYISLEKYTPNELVDACNNPVVLHFPNNNKKLWNNQNSESKDVKDWWNYARKTGFFDEIQKKYASVNKKK